MGINSKRQRNPKEHAAWSHMTQRCNNPKHPRYQHYGGRGIKVCEHWLKFENFLADIGPAPSEELSLDRIDNNGNYEPGNVRWATTQQQNENRRMVKVINGKSYAQISRELGGNRLLVSGRVRQGWSLEDAISKPYQKSMARNPDTIK